MSQSITVTLPPDIENSVRELSTTEGITPEEVISRAVRQHLFLRQFRTLRERMAAKAVEQGILTDEDVFKRVS
jgi:hypothetical protein